MGEVIMVLIAMTASHLYIIVKDQKDRARKMGSIMALKLCSKGMITHITS
jgi:hypothetical protein